MILNKVKNIIPIASLALTLCTTSCVNDLDVESINPQKEVTLDTDALFNKIYSNFSLTGQTGAAGNSDIDDVDEGRSDYFRSKWYLNEFAADCASWVWYTDAGVGELIHNSWGADCIFSAALYNRLYTPIVFCNLFISKVDPSESEEKKHEVAEARFIRALYYADIMDLYGNAALVTEVPDPGNSEVAPRATRKELYSYVVKELTECKEDMSDAGTATYGRADKVAAELLLARIYLNAEVYAGENHYSDALTCADNVLKNGHYELLTAGKTNPKTGEVYSPYQLLFLGDNDSNGAQKEVILPALFDGIETKSYGGTNFLIQASYANDNSMTTDVPSGLNNSWDKCITIRKNLLDLFYENGLNPTTRTAPTTNSIATMTNAANDDRALFYGKGYKESIEKEGNKDYGFNCVKFRNINSDGTDPDVIDFCNTDLPLMRMAEAYLIYAEADARIHNGTTTSAGAEKIHALRDRANCTNDKNTSGSYKKTSYSLDEICDEWGREFWFEGNRRTTLIRFGKYAGQANYKWEWMGGEYEGTAFASYRSIYPLPANELANNSNLIQNTGY